MPRRSSRSRPASFTSCREPTGSAFLTAMRPPRAPSDRHCSEVGGHTIRYFEELETELPVTCPQCGDALRARCPSCDARFPSAFQVECEACGAEVRPPELFGGPIRKPGRYTAPHLHSP